jgi:diguanylate cyclase (GGDEF)-like protein/PAS domain S-box-containing protein
MHILLIEEDAQDYLSIRRFLDEQANKSEVDWAPNYEIALKFAKTKNYDIYLVGYYPRQAKQKAFLSWLYRFAQIPVLLLLKNEEELQYINTLPCNADYLLKEKLDWQLLQRIMRQVHRLSEIQRVCQHYELAFKHTSHFVAILSTNGEILEANKIALDYLGSNLEQVQYRPAWEVGWVVQRQAQLKKSIAAAAKGEQIRYELELETKQNGNLAVDFSLIPIKNQIGKVLWLLAEARDLSERKQVEQQLHHCVLHDQLTGLANRQLFFEYLERATQKAIRNLDGGFAVLCIDLDRFRMINESLGHDMGDWLLMEIAARLHNCLTPNDLLARFGGDEFAILQENINDFTQTIKLAEEINTSLAEPFLLDGCEIVTSASIGITYSHGNQDTEAASPERLIRNADTAMHWAKKLGKSRYAVYNQNMRTYTLSRLRIEAELHRGLEHNDFVLFYQPQMDLLTERIDVVEALIRFNHPHRGLIPPMEFVPILEDNGMIVNLSEWVLYTACTQFKDWLTKGLPMRRVAVNLSALQFKSQNLSQIVTKVLQQTKLDARHLELELTEHSLLEDTKIAAKTINRFREMGICITIDDFGTGYASPSYLKYFPANCLKIDKSFIRDVNEVKVNAEITKSLIQLAHALGMRVVAEGVETIKQRDFLRQHYCDAVQGYLYAPAMSSTDFLNWAQQYCAMQLHSKNR